MAVQRAPLCPAARANWLALTEAEAEAGNSGVFELVPAWMNPMKPLDAQETAVAKSEAGAHAYLSALQDKGRVLRSVDLLVCRALSESLTLPETAAV